MAMLDANGGLALHLCSGVPVVEVSGEWNANVERSIADVLQRLARAGHLEIVVNLIGATRMESVERVWVVGLERLAASANKHHVRLAIVASLDAAHESIRRQSDAILRWAGSEEEAICRIKRIRFAPNCGREPMRFA